MGEARRVRVRPWCLAPVLVLAGISATLVASSTLRGALGLGRRPPAFADLAQVTATAGCVSPSAGNIGASLCDPYGRAYNYPPVWHLVLHALGVGPGATVPLAVALVVLALGAVTVLLARLDLPPRALVAVTAVVASPPMWLLVVRGNTDLLLLALVAVSVLVPGSRVGGPVLIALAAALKLYPLGAALGRLGDRRRLLVATVVAALGAATVLGSLAAIRVATPSRTVSSFGAGVLPAVLRSGVGSDVTGSDQVEGVVAVVVLGAIALAVPGIRRAATALAGDPDDRPVARAAVGSGTGLFLVTHLATTSYDYRLWALVLLAAGLLALPRGPAGRVVVVLVVVTAWASYPLRDLQWVGDLAASALVVALVPLTAALGLRALRRRGGGPEVDRR